MLKNRVAIRQRISVSRKGRFASLPCLRCRSCPAAGGVEFCIVSLRCFPKALGSGPSHLTVSTLYNLTAPVGYSGFEAVGGKMPGSPPPDLNI